MATQHLLMISRNDILNVADAADHTALFRLLAWLTRNGFHLIATAPMPDHHDSREQWLKGGGDAALVGPDSIRSRVVAAGGTLDGVYYVPKSLILQKKNRLSSLRDMLERYAVAPDSAWLFSSSKRWVEAALELNIRATALSSSNDLLQHLAELKRQFSTK